MSKLFYAALSALMLTFGFVTSTTAATYDFDVTSGLSASSGVSDGGSTSDTFLNFDDGFADSNFAFLMTFSPQSGSTTFDWTVEGATSAYEVTLSLTSPITATFTQAAWQSLGSAFDILVDSISGGVNFTYAWGTVPGGGAQFADDVIDIGSFFDPSDTGGPGDGGGGPDVSAVPLPASALLLLGGIAGLGGMGWNNRRKSA